MPRLFVALRPDATDLASVAALPRPQADGVHWVDPADWHVTLRFLGDCDVDEARAALDGVELPHVTPRLGPTVTLINPRTLVVPVNGVDPVQVAVARATRGLGDDDGRPFRGHLTLARLSGTRPALLGRQVTDSFDGDAVHLVSSTRHADGAVHEVVGSWPTTR